MRLWGSWTPRLPPSRLRPAAPASPRAGASHREQWVAPSSFLAAPLLIDAPPSLFFMGCVAFLPRCGPPRPALCSSLLWQGLSLAVSPSSLPVALSSPLLRLPGPVRPGLSGPPPRAPCPTFRYKPNSPLALLGGSLPALPARPPSTLALGQGEWPRKAPSPFRMDLRLSCSKRDCFWPSGVAASFSHPWY